MKNKILKEDIKMIESLIVRKYPEGTHFLGLYDDFDYYNSLLIKFIDNKLLEIPVDLRIDKDITLKISDYVNQKNHDEMLIYYLMLKTSLLILKKYYNDDGTLK